MQILLTDHVDLMLLKVDGFTVVKRLRCDYLTADIPVLMLTALGDTQTKLMAFMRVQTTI